VHCLDFLVVFGHKKLVVSAFGVEVETDLVGTALDVYVPQMHTLGR
jgi:hypothetical protein